MKNSSPNKNLMDLNMQKFLDYAFKIMPVKSDNLALIYYSNLSDNHKNILEAYFGLDGTKSCNSTKELAIKLNNPNADILLKEAEIEFKNQPYIEMLIDKDNFDKNTAVSLGEIAAYVYFGPRNKYQCVQNIFSGSTLLNLIETVLSQRQKQILKLRYGLDGSERMPTKKIAKLLSLGNKSINTNISYAIRKLETYISIFVKK